MFRKLLSVLGIGTTDTPAVHSAASSNASGPPFNPYRQDAANQAYNQLFSDGAPPSLLGVIVETHTANGLDVLAATSDGTVRYITKTGKLLDVDGTPSLQAAAASLLKASGALAAGLRPAEGPRLPPPVKDNARLTLLLPEGRSFMEGSMAAMVKDPTCGPVFRQAIDLLQLAMAASVAKIMGGSGGKRRMDMSN